jgi:hypothetical protein
MVYWLQRLPEDVPEYWAQPFALPMGLTEKLPYDYHCAGAFAAVAWTDVQDRIEGLPVALPVSPVRG